MADGKAGAPFGNKNGVGHGRPPNPGFSDADLEIIGKDLLDWCKKQDDEKKEVVHLSEFYSEVKNIAYSQWESIIKRDCFIGYYEKAKDWMGKRILKNDRMPTAYGSRFLGMYCKDLFKHEREQVEHKIDYELKRKKEMGIDGQSAPNDLLLDRDKEIIQLKAKILELESKDNGSKS